MQKYQVGQLLLKDKIEEGFTSLVFIDTPYSENDNKVFYTQIALILKIENDFEGYFGIEAGSAFLTSIIRPATNDDIKLFTLACKDPQTLSKWKEDLNNDTVLLDSEKSRLFNSQNSTSNN